MDYVVKAAPKVDTVILDGELLLMDSKNHIPLPFGTLNKHKKNDFKDANVCVFIYDILFLNGEVLLNEPFEKRRATIEKYVTVSRYFIKISSFFFSLFINVFVGYS